jgi:hypothetical protein
MRMNIVRFTGPISSYTGTTLHCRMNGVTMDPILWEDNTKIE